MSISQSYEAKKAAICKAFFHQYFIESLAFILVWLSIILSLAVQVDVWQTIAFNSAKINLELYPRTILLVITILGARITGILLLSTCFICSLVRKIQPKTYYQNRFQLLELTESYIILSLCSAVVDLTMTAPFLLSSDFALYIAWNQYNELIFYLFGMVFAGILLTLMFTLIYVSKEMVTPAQDLDLEEFIEKCNKLNDVSVYNSKDSYLVKLLAFFQNAVLSNRSILSFPLITATNQLEVLPINTKENEVWYSPKSPALLSPHSPTMRSKQRGMY